jgi:hypothetical protein
MFWSIFWESLALIIAIVLAGQALAGILGGRRN